MTWSVRSMTWHFVLIFRPASVSSRIGVDHAARNAQHYCGDLPMPSNREVEERNP
jgi:hypothetical protein